MVNIKLIEMRKKVQEELEHVPTGDIKQNMLRQLYFTLRMNSLGKKSRHPNDKNQILKTAIQHEQEYWIEENQEFIPNYDKKYFKI